MASFTPDSAVIQMGTALLVVAAAFQLSDGTQVICGGALRGAGDTVRPLIAQSFAHWVIAIPLGAWLAFGFGLDAWYGAQAVWWALALGSCLGGNGTPIGASANVIVIGIAARSGFFITFLKFCAYGMPAMVLTLAISHVYVWLRYF